MHSCMLQAYLVPAHAHDGSRPQLIHSSSPSPTATPAPLPQSPVTPTPQVHTLLVRRVVRRGVAGGVISGRHVARAAPAPAPARPRAAQAWPCDLQLGAAPPAVLRRLVGAAPCLVGTSVGHGLEAAADACGQVQNREKRRAGQGGVIRCTIGTVLGGVRLCFCNGTLRSAPIVA